MKDRDPVPEDAALAALTTLSAVTSQSLDDINAIKDELAVMRRRRRRGWSWQRIVSAPDVNNPLTRLATVVANLGRASGEFRRATARELQTEGMRIAEIGALMEVSRQRISALIQPRRPT